MVEKIKRDVRITTIYEGTSEIMEMTISRDRWQQHLKTRGQHYHDKAEDSRRCTRPASRRGRRRRPPSPSTRWPQLLERCRVARLTRHQHVLFRLGELVARAEGAGCARPAGRPGRRAAALDEKADARFAPDGLAAAGPRVRPGGGPGGGHGRAALGPGRATPGRRRLDALQPALGLPAIHAAQSGLLDRHGPRGRRPLRPRAGL